MSAVLLLLVQPTLSKAILPSFGGSAGVWTTSLLFFQVFLLLGYLYAHVLATRLSLRSQVIVHIGLLVVSLFFLPIFPRVPASSSSDDPVSGILAVLFSSVGLPYFLLASTSPLIQSWYVARTKSTLSYRLYAVSNLGSLLALLAYPFVVEPLLSTRNQLFSWSAGYLGFTALATALALYVALGASKLEERRAPMSFDISGSLVWIALAACASTLFLAIANHLSQDVAPVPFLWVLPFAIYLLSFVLCFDRSGWYRPRVFRWLLPLAWIVICLAVAQAGVLSIKASVALMSAALFVCCMFCHGELARAKPETSQLTAFYLSMAIGGALGGVFVSLIAPRIFTGFMELPVAVLGTVLLAAGLLYSFSPKRVLRLGIVTGAAVIAALAIQPDALDAEVQVRNFYGTLHTETFESGESRYRALYNGTIQHGIQFLSPSLSRTATTYYGRTSGVAIAIATLRRPGMRVGVVGLGAGTLAAYAKPGDSYRIYEINPDVIRISRSHFRYLRDAGAPVEIVPGDARLSLEKEAVAQYDVLAVDAFSGDSIPVHLLTREAVALYFRHLKPDGALVIHVTNKHLQLAPVVKALARNSKAESVLIHNTSEDSSKIYASSWMIVTHNLPLANALQSFGSPVEPSRELWTDDYTNLLRTLK